jgi:type 1 glutamine amidotransferase
MNNKTFVISGALLAALWGTAPNASAAIKPEDLAKVQAALPDKAQVAPAQARKLLIYTRSNGFVHSSIDLGAEALRLMGEKSGAYTATISDDPKSFEPENLKNYDAVAFVSTTGDAFRPAGFDKLNADEKKAATANEERYKAALLEFVKGGKGWMGIHAATDSYYGWQDYGKMTGGYFDGHPWHEKVGIDNQDPNSPLNAMFNGQDFEITDEIYQFKDYNRNNQRVLTALDLAKTNLNRGGVKRMDGDFAVSWAKTLEKGRVFYCSLGHREEIYWNPVVMKHYLAGLQFAMGDLKADTAPLPLPAETTRLMRAWIETPIAPENVNDTLHGVYTGNFLPSPQAAVAPRTVVANVLAQGGNGNNDYLITLDVPEGDGTKRVEIPAKKEGDKLTIAANAGGADWKGGLEGGNLKLSGVGEWTLARDAKASATAGLKPPANAVVLLPYAEGQAPKLDEWQNQNWRRVNDGSMMVNAGDQRTKREFGDIRLHLEFQTPYMPGSRGQGRGNSGVYLQDRYEVQVLDSFGLPPKDNEVGGIYQIAVPKVNAGLPPGTWQTYDMAFRAARFNADGSVKSPPTITIYLNGQLIHDNVVIPRTTGGAAGNTHVAKGSLRLQDHGDRVRYRNIWVVEEKFADEGPLPNPLELNKG